VEFMPGVPRPAGATDVVSPEPLQAHRPSSRA
jgi:hypothetical protein